MEKKKLIQFTLLLKLLGDEAVQDWKRVYYNNEDAYYEEDDDKHCEIKSEVLKKIWL